MEDDDSQKVDSISNVYASIYSNNENFRTLFDEIEIGTDYINISKETKTKQTLLEGSFTDEGLGTALIISNRLFLLCFPTLRNPIVTYQYSKIFKFSIN